MFAPFSRAYYLGRLYVEPYDGDRPVIHDEQHEAVNERLYGTETGISRLDNPLVMKLGNRHLSVHGESGIPGRTLAVPATLADETNDELPALREVLLAKADRAKQLQAMGLTTGQ
ncbi:DUF5802 family protein [Halocatena halophila]|uniref:DUF5802 family protein n=1 Tax=Halocatena halophila TaxID=2814576 RepID=UPI002ED471F2